MLITEDYLDLLRRYRTDNPEWGPGGDKRHARLIQPLIEEWEPSTIVDYGCGGGQLVRILQNANPDVTVSGYDPSHPDFDVDPVLADMVVSTDVLEHIEPDCLHDVLSHIASITTDVAYLTIAITPSEAVLADGRNAHLIVEPAEWWEDTLKEHFDQVGTYDSRKADITFTCTLPSHRLLLSDLFENG